GATFAPSFARSWRPIAHGTSLVSSIRARSEHHDSKDHQAGNCRSLGRTGASRAPNPSTRGVGTAVDARLASRLGWHAQETVERAFHGPIVPAPSRAAAQDRRGGRLSCLRPRTKPGAV